MVTLFGVSDSSMLFTFLPGKKLCINARLAFEAKVAPAIALCVENRSCMAGKLENVTDYQKREVEDDDG